jgi:hypothetical protein
MDAPFVNMMEVNPTYNDHFSSSCAYRKTKATLVAINGGAVPTFCSVYTDTDISVNIQKLRCKPDSTVALGGTINLSLAKTYTFILRRSSTALGITSNDTTVSITVECEVL